MSEQGEKGNAAEGDLPRKPRKPKKKKPRIVEVVNHSMSGRKFWDTQGNPVHPGQRARVPEPYALQLVSKGLVKICLETDSP